MEKDLLQAVIKLESAIQQSIESERIKAAEWLESVRVSLSRELEAKRQQLEEEFARALETTCMECRIKAAKEITDVTRLAENLQNLPDEVLQDVVREFVQDILPTER
jgi:hypothetical protein